MHKLFLPSFGRETPQWVILQVWSWYRPHQRCVIGHTYAYSIIKIQSTHFLLLSSISRDAANEKTTLVDSDQALAKPSKRKASITTSDGSNYLEMYSYDAFIARESYTVLVVRQQSGKKTLEEEIDGKETISYFRLSNGSTSEKSTYHREPRCYKRLKESSLWQLLR